MTTLSSDSNVDSVPAGVVVEGSVLSVPISLVRPFADQPRHHFCQVRLTELANSIKEVGQITAVEVRELPVPDQDGHVYELIDGQRRWHACQMAGLDRIRLTVTVVADQAEQFRRSIVANFGRAGHTPMEICAALCQLEKDGTTQVMMANMLGRSSAWVSSHMSLARLVPSVQAMLHPDHPQKLGLKTGVMLANLPPDLQVVLAERISRSGDQGMTEVAARMTIRATAGEYTAPARGKGRPTASVWKSFSNLMTRMMSQCGVYFDLADRDYRVTLARLAAKDVASRLHAIRNLSTDLMGLTKRIERQYPDREALALELKKCQGGHDDETTARVGDPGVVVPTGGDSVSGDGRVGARHEQSV